MKGGKHLILVGLPGSGKSTVGKRLAELLSLPFTDLDEAIQVKVGQTIPRYFAGHGEAAFRDVESAALRQALEHRRRCRAAGGKPRHHAAKRLRVLFRPPGGEHRKYAGLC